MTFISLLAPMYTSIRQYGATGNGTTDDTSAINNTLSAALAAGGGVVFAPAGNYLISSPLVIGSNMTLLSAPGTTYTLASGSNCNMIKNAAVTAQRSVSDAAITSSSTTLTSATAAFTSADVGRTVAVSGAWTGSHVLIANILTINSSTSVTISVAASATVSGAACSIYNRDTSIEIAGGYWQRGSNGYPGGTTSGVAYQTTLFRHIDGISVHDATFACSQKGYQLALGDVTNYTARNITLVTPNSVVNTDGVNIHGPAQFGLIDSIHGTTGDDMISVHGIDGDGNLQDTIGNVTDLMVTNLFPSNVGQSAFKVHGGSSTLMRSITCKCVHGSANAGAIHIQDYATPNSDNNAGDIIVEDVDVLTTGAGLVNIYCNNSTGTITLKNLVWRQALANASIVDVLSGNTLRNLIIDGLQIEAGSADYGVLVEGTLTNLVVNNVTAPDTAVQFNGVVQVQSSVSVSTVTVRNALTYLPSAAQNTIVSNKGSVKSIVLDNIYMNNGGIAFVQKNSGAANAQVLMSNITLDAAYQLAQVQTSSTADFTMTNINAISQNQTALIAVTGTGANFTLRGRGLINPNSYTAFSRDASQTPHIIHAEMQTDLSTLAKSSGDEAFNTNGSLSCGTGRCISNGSNWKNVYTGSTF